MPETSTLKLYYGTDAQGFYWPGSAQKRKEILNVKRNDPSTFESVYQGRPGRRIGRIFVADDFAYYEPPEGLNRGISDPKIRQFCQKGNIFQAWDTAFSTSTQAAYTVCVTGLFISCSDYHRGENSEILGICDNHYDVLILEVLRKKLDYGSLVNEVKAQNVKWRPDAVLIENRASGISLIQTLPSSNVPIEAINVGTSGKGERAINRVDEKAAGSVQGWYRNHRVLHPKTADWLDTFEAEMKDFSGENDSSSDQVDGAVHLITHGIRLSTQTTLLPTDFDVRRLEADVRSETLVTVDPLHTDPREIFLQYLGGLEDNVLDPFDGTCSRCERYDNGHCNLLGREVIAMDNCGMFNARPAMGFML